MSHTYKPADLKLASYGTLAPGRENYHQLKDLNGKWIKGTVRGKVIQTGWGQKFGYPGLILDPDGESVEVFVFESEDLPGHWARLDEFEGPGYNRVTTRVSTDAGEIEASIYEVVVEA